ncbi:MAG: BrnT family toxin [Armatimonadetes bacterium]|nr:BrnT family toxin [Armatimonadota bacterium]
MKTKHGVSFDEAVEAAGSSPRYYRTHATAAGERRYMVPGKTADGRHLWVIFVDEGNGIGRIITARPVQGRRESARHKRLRGD